MYKDYDNLRDFFSRNQDAVFRFWVKKKIFTPYEVEKAWSDQSVFEDDMSKFGRVREFVKVGDNDCLLGIQEIFEEGEESDGCLYYWLSDIVLEQWSGDQICIC